MQFASSNVQFATEFDFELAVRDREREREASIKADWPDRCVSSAPSFRTVRRSNGSAKSSENYSVDSANFAQRVRSFERLTEEFGAELGGVKLAPSLAVCEYVCFKVQRECKIGLITEQQLLVLMARCGELCEISIHTLWLIV